MGEMKSTEPKTCELHYLETVFICGVCNRGSRRVYRRDGRWFCLSCLRESLKQAAESAVRQVIGGSDMDTILSSHGSDVVGETKKLLQQ